MTVKRLIEHLSLLDPDLQVIVSQDEEGNGYRSLHSLETSFAVRVGHNDWELDDKEYEGSVATVILY